MRVLVCGGRDYDDALRVQDVLDGLVITKLIHGDCGRGADKLADNYGFRRGIEIVTYPAQWAKYGRRAGPIRNQAMLVHGKPDLVVAFPGGRGTADMVARARKAGVRVMVVEADDRRSDSVQAGGKVGSDQ
jgi:hypothetical protein